VDGEAKVSTPTTITSRFPFEPHIKDMPPQQQYVIRNLWNVAFDAQNAISILKPQIDANKSAVTAVTKTVNNNTTSQTVIQQITSAFGTVNNQSGNTAYATAASDASAFIILSDASPVAVSLTGTPVITLPWACTILNFGAGTATLTPASGTITYSGNVAAASLVLPQYFAAFISFDGTNFWSVIVPIGPQNTPAITHEFVTAYNSTTGAFSQAAPVIADVTGLSAALALLAPIASPTFTGTVTQPTPSVLTAAVTATSATTGAASPLPTDPAGYLEMSVNGVTVKVPYYNL
jgi:hypothetical protein